MNKQKERKHLGKNERTTETNRKDQKPETKKDGTYQFSRFYLRYMYPYTKRSIYLSRAVSRTHARTHAQRPSQAYFHPFFLDYITQKGIPPRHKRKSGHGIPGEPERERERNIFIWSRPYHRVRLHLTSARLISAHHSRRRGRRRRRERRRLSNHPTTTLRCIRPDPVFSSIHSTIRYVTSW